MLLHFVSELWWDWTTYRWDRPVDRKNCLVNISVGEKTEPLCDGELKIVTVADKKQGVKLSPRYYNVELRNAALFFSTRSDPPALLFARSTAATFYVRSISHSGMISVSGPGGFKAAVKITLQ